MSFVEAIDCAEMRSWSRDRQGVELNVEKHPLPDGRGSKSDRK